MLHRVKHTGCSSRVRASLTATPARMVTGSNSRTPREVADEQPVVPVVRPACRFQDRRVTARCWTALGCVVVGVWLLAIAVIYGDWLGLAVGLLAVLFGATQLRRGT